MKQLDLLEVARTLPVDRDAVERVRERVAELLDCAHDRIRHDGPNEARCVRCSTRMVRSRGDWKPAP